VQFGRTATLYRHPATLEAARVFSDPPLNELEIERRGGALITTLGQFPLPSALSGMPEGHYTMAFRADAVSVDAPPRHGIDFDGLVSVSEINGSESFVHVVVGGATWVSLVPGVYAGQPGDTVTAHIDLDQVFLFDAAGAVATSALMAEAV
jgi:glycerol transport system ATP-binding protein